jgi:putative sterol carrier protein
MSESKSNDAIAVITKDFQETSKGKSGFGKKVKLDFGQEGIILIDGTGKDIAISNEDKDADMTVVLTVDTFTKMGEGTLPGDKAVEQGLLTIEGDLSLAKVLEDTLSGS